MARRDKTLRHIGAYVSPEKHAALEAAGKKLGLSLQKTIEAALDTLLANAGVAIPEPGSPSPEEQVWIRKLLDLLRSSDAPRIEVVRFVIDAHSKHRPRVKGS